MALRRVRLALVAGAVLVTLSVSARGDEPGAKKAASKTDANSLTVEIEAEVASDYIYRGVSLSARQPTARTSIDVEHGSGLYAYTNFQSVKLPTQPAAEITLAGGYRWSMWDFKFDFAANYFYYPGEIATDTTTTTSYWEYGLRGSREFENVTFDSLLAYSPNVSQTGAWGAYAEGEVTFKLPRLNLLRDINWNLVATAGYWRFGNTSPVQGGFPLPAYANWRVGLQFDLTENLNLDLSYYDTSLSREDCFVFTGDPMATPGGAVNLVTNPDGLRSRLCGAAFVGTLTVTFDPLKKKN